MNHKADLSEITTSPIIVEMFTSTSMGKAKNKAYRLHTYILCVSLLCGTLLKICLTQVAMVYYLFLASYNRESYPTLPGVGITLLV